MFTGLIQSTGTVLSSSANRLTITAQDFAPGLRTGDSIAVNGVCLTALDLTPTTFSADLAAETLARTTLATLTSGRLVNLELPTPAGTPLGGHIVQGHVDGIATLAALDALPSGDWRLHIQLPQALTANVVPQGSIAVDGISLTVAALHDSILEIAILPHTYAATTLHMLRPGASVNIETDVLARYAANEKKTPRAELTEAYLLANGY